MDKALNEAIYFNIFCFVLYCLAYCPVHEMVTTWESLPHYIKTDRNIQQYCEKGIPKQEEKLNWTTVLGCEVPKVERMQSEEIEFLCSESLSEKPFRKTI